MRFIAIPFLMIFSMNLTLAAQNQPEMEIDNSGKGAVLCLHSIVAVALAFARICKPEGQIEIQRLEKAISRFEAFEVDHGKWAVAQAKEFTANAISETFPKAVGKEFCKSATNSNFGLFENFYIGFGGENSSKAVTDILSVPRKPVMNPCF